MKKLFLSLLIVLPWLSVAQHDEAYVDGLVNAFSQELVARGIDKIVVYKSYCEGETQMITIKGKLCISKGTYYQVYVVWKEAEQDRLKKFDNCGVFETEILPDSGMSSFYEKEWPALLDDEVKPYHSATYTGQPELRKTPQPCYREFKFKSSAKEVHKKFNLFALSNDSDGENLNYAFNRTLKLVALYEKMDEVIQNIPFTRE